MITLIFFAAVDAIAAVDYCHIIRRRLIAFLPD